MIEKNKPQSQINLQRKLTWFPLTNIVVANMIGAGIFTTSGLLMADLKNPIVMLALWVVGGGVALCGALSYGEIGAAMPHAGGEYVFLSKLYHPVLGFLSGWVSFIVGFSAPIAASSIGFSEYFTRAFPQLFEWLGFVEPVVVKKGLSIIVILLFSLVHLRGIEFGTKIQNGLTLLKVGLVAGLIFIGFTLGSGDIRHLTLGDPFALNFSGWKTLGLSLMWIMFAYSGWNASVYIGSEVRNPEKNLPRSLFFGTGIVLVLYLGLNLLFVYAVKPDDMGGVISIGGLAVNRLFGQSLEIAISILISFALFSSLSAFIILGPRVYYAMAKDGYFFRSVAKIHLKYHVPTKAIFLQAAISIVMVMSGTFDQILTYMGFSLGIFPILTVLGVFKLRKSSTRYHSHGFPFVQIFYIGIGLLILVLAYLERPLESSIAVLTVVVGVPIYYLFKKYS